MLLFVWIALLGVVNILIVRLKYARLGVVVVYSLTLLCSYSGWLSFHFCFTLCTLKLLTKAFTDGYFGYELHKYILIYKLSFYGK